LTASSSLDRRLTALLTAFLLIFSPPLLTTPCLPPCSPLCFLIYLPPCLLIYSPPLLTTLAYHLAHRLAYCPCLPRASVSTTLSNSIQLVAGGTVSSEIAFRSKHLAEFSAQRSITHF
jgi:hypothetical protein